MTADVTILAVVLASFAAGVGLKLLKVEPGSDKRHSEIYGRDIAGMIIIVLAISAGFFSLQSLQVAGGGGAPALYRCPAETNILAYGPGDCGVIPIGNSTITQVQQGSETCTSNTITANCVGAAMTFATPYSRVPNWNATFCYGSASTVPVCSTTTNLGSASTAYTQTAEFQAFNGTTWMNMTSSGPVELYSCFTTGPNGYPKCHPQANQELQISVPTGATNIQAKFCVNVVQPSQNATAVLFPEFGTTPISDGNGQLNAVVGSSTGFICTNPFGNSNLPTGAQTLKVMGEFGMANAFCSPSCATNPICSTNNVGAIGTNVDCPVFGNIELTYTYTITQTVTGPNPCTTFVFSLTATTIRPAVRCNSVPNNVVTFHLAWMVGILA